MKKSDYLSLDRVWKMLLILVLLFVSSYYASSVLIPIVFSAFLTVILNPIVCFLEKKKIPTGISIVTTILLFVSLIIVMIYIASSQAKSLVSDVPDLVDRFNNFLDISEQKISQLIGFSNRDQIELIRENSGGIISSSTGMLSNAFVATSSVLSFLTLVPIYVVFMLLSRNNLRNFLKAIGKRNGRDYLAIGSEMKEMVHSYIGGLLIVISIVSVLNTIGLLALGIKHAIFLGILSGVLTIIPYVGILVGGLIPVIVALLTKDSLFYPLAVIGLIGLVQFLEGNFITPKVIGSKVNISPLAAIIALIIGASVWGIVGMILAIPLLGIVKIVLESFDSLKPYALLLAADVKEQKSSD